MTSHFGLFLFDIDGTLLRGATAVHRDAFVHAYHTVYGCSLDLNGIVAAGRTDTWLLVQPLRRLGMSEDQIAMGMPRAFAEMEDYVDRRLRDIRDRVLPGVAEVLARLREEGFLLGLLTGNLHGIALAKMRHAGLAEFFDSGGFGDESEVRAHLVPVAMENVVRKTGRPVSPDQTVVIGDTPLDIEAGRMNGTRTAGVATGPYSCDDLQLAGADVVLSSMQNVDQAVEALTALLPTRPSES